MGTHKDDFNERRSAAAAAKRTMAAKFRAQPSPDDPAILERRTALKAIGDAREVRHAERKAAREAEAARQVAEQAARIAEQAAQDAAQVARRGEEAARKADLEVERKATRDARYAARKARR